MPKEALGFCEQQNSSNCRTSWEKFWKYGNISPVSAYIYFNSGSGGRERERGTQLSVSKHMYRKRRIALMKARSFYRCPTVGKITQSSDSNSRKGQRERGREESGNGWVMGALESFIE